jgi:hypothetical protein
MMSKRWMFRALCGATSIILGGCWSPGPGYNSYPGYYAPPNQGYMAPPPGTMVSPGVTYPQPQMGAPAIPGNGGTWAPAGPGPTLAPTPMNPPSGPPGAMAPLPGEPPQSFNRDRPTFIEPRVGASPRSETPVPDPIDTPRNAPGPPASSVPAPNEKSPFGSDGADKPFDSGASMQAPRRADGPQSVAAEAPDSFEGPLDRGGKIDTGVVAVAAKTVDAKTRVGEPNRYDYDHVSYSYLRGVVDFDRRDKSWHIIYNPSPDRKDRYGGAFQLIDNAKLTALHDGDVVFIQGRVHPQLVDSRGKAKYEIGDEVARIMRRATQSVGN